MVQKTDTVALGGYKVPVVITTWVASIVSYPHL